MESQFSAFTSASLVRHISKALFVGAGYLNRFGFMHTRSLLMLTILILSTGCRSNEPRKSNEPRNRTPVARGPESIQSAFLEEVVPLTSGGAYAIGTEGVWYLSGPSAVRVRPLGDSATRADFAAAVSLEVQPTLDGGAYAFEITGRIWHLRADSAVLVKEEASTVPADTTVRSRVVDSAAWLLYTRERRLRQMDAEDGRAELPVPDDSDRAEQFR
jgi:hypothetical protein